MTPSPARLLIVDDHPIVRTGLAALLETEADLSVCAQAEGYDDGLEALVRLAPDLAIIDLAIKASSGLDLVRQCKRLGIRSLVVSMQDSPIWVERSLGAGASGYVQKSDAGRTIVQAVRRVLAGRTYLSESLPGTSAQRSGAQTGGATAVRHPVQQLADRELEVFVRIGRGLSSRQISEELHISAKTVQTYRERIKQKLGLDRSAELSREAARWVLEGDR